MEASPQSSAESGVTLVPPPIPDHELLRRIGRGSYGEVWLARCALGRYRAVKLVRRSSFPDDRPFEREFDGIRQFEPLSRQDDSQVDILHVGRTADCFYYVMELADDASGPAEDRSENPARKNGPAGAADGAPAGEGGAGGVADPQRYTPKTLKSELARRGHLPVEECLEVALALTRALQHLHDHGLVHRDVKPSNIIFVGGVPKLADLGLVTSLDATRSFVGTEGYIPPEGPGTPQADLYSLGKVLYEISTGRPRAEFPEPLTQWSGSGKESGPAWPEFFEVVLKACEPDPRRRYRSAREMRAELALLQSGKSVRHVHSLERRLASARRIGLTAGVLLLGVLAANLLMVYQRQQVQAQAHRADLEAGRARRAEQQACAEVWKANLAEAQARRWTGRVGRRFESLAALARAAAIRPSLELRNEVIACLALADVRPAPGMPSIALSGALGFDPAYQRYACVGADGTVVVSRLSDHRELARFAGAGQSCPFLGFSPDGRCLAFAHGGAHPTVEIWRLEPRESVLRLDPALARTLDFTADSRLVAVSLQSANFPIRVYDLGTGRELASFEHGTLPFTVRFHPKEPRLLLTSDETPQVRLWDWRTGRLARTFEFTNWVAGLDWHPEGGCFAAASGDRQVWFWETASDQPRVALAGHQEAVVNVTYSFDGQYLASRGWDGMAFVWDCSARQEVLRTPICGFIYPFSRPGYKLACSLDQSGTSLLELAPPTGYRRCHRAPGASQRNGACAFSPEGGLLLSAHEDHFRLWDVATGRELAIFSQPGSLRFAAFAPDGRRLYLCTTQGLVTRRLEVRALEETLLLDRPQPLAAGLRKAECALSADGTVLAFRSGGMLHRLDLAAERDRPAPLNSADAGALACATRGALVAWAPRHGPVEVWDAAGSQPVQRLPSGSVCVAFSPDNRWLVVGYWGEYRVWNVADWSLRYALPRRIGSYSAAAAFSPDSQVLAVADLRQAVHLLEAATGRLLATLEPPDAAEISALAFAADGSRLAVSTSVGPVHLWDLRVLRQELAALKLDWDLPPLPAASPLKACGQVVVRDEAGGP